MCYQPDYRSDVSVSLKRGHHVAMLVEFGIAKSGFAQLGYQQPRQLELTGSTRRRRAVALRLRIDLDVAEEPPQHVGCELLCEGGCESADRHPN